MILLIQPTWPFWLVSTGFGLIYLSLKKIFLVENLNKLEALSTHPVPCWWKKKDAKRAQSGSKVRNQGMRSTPTSEDQNWGKITWML